MEQVKKTKAIKISGTWIPRMAIFSLSCFTLYFVMAPFPIPSLYNLGETRILLVSILSRIVEEAIYSSMKTSLIRLEEEMPTK